MVWGYPHDSGNLYKTGLMPLSPCKSKIEIVPSAQDLNLPHASPIWPNTEPQLIDDKLLQSATVPQKRSLPWQKVSRLLVKSCQITLDQLPVAGKLERKTGMPRVRCVHL